MLDKFLEYFLGILFHYDYEMYAKSGTCKDKYVHQIKLLLSKRFQPISLTLDISV